MECPVKLLNRSKIYQKPCNIPRFTSQLFELRYLYRLMKLRQLDGGLFVLLGLILGLSVFFYRANMQHPPELHHAWSMSDYYALALRFNEQHLNIFRPQTYNLQTLEGVTSSDFPLPAWLCAVVMRVSGSTEPLIFRLLSWMVSTIAFILLYRALIAKATSASISDRLPAIVRTLFVWLLPTFVYFNNAFIPSTWAFSAFLIACWAYQHQKTSWVIFALTLAALLRKPYILWLFAFASLLWQQKAPGKQWRIWLTGLSVFFAWQVYDWYLGQHYGQLFLRSVRPPASFQEAYEALFGIFSKWGLVWFSPWHLVWLVFGLVLIALNPRLPKTSMSIGVPLTGLGIAFCYFLGMERQFWDHDYYVLDSFYPALVLFVIWINEHNAADKRLLWPEIGLLCGAFLWAAPIQQFYQNAKRFETTEKTNHAYAAAKPMFDAVDPDGKAKVLIFEAYSFNLPLIGIRREGYCLLSSKAEVQQAALSRQPDLVACLDTFFVSEVVQDNPAIVSQLRFLKSDGTVLLFKPELMPEQRLEALLGKQSQILADTSLQQDSGEYLLTQQVPLHGPQKILFYGQMGLEPAGTLKATVAAFKGDKMVYYAEKPMTTNAAKTMQFKSTSIDLPALDADFVKIYLWNLDKRAVQLAGFRISMVVPWH